jgi:hypothetical protein
MVFSTVAITVGTLEIAVLSHCLVQLFWSRQSEPIVGLIAP